LRSAARARRRRCRRVGGTNFGPCLATVRIRLAPQRGWRAVRRPGLVGGEPFKKRGEPRVALSESC
jgi:hypothetical protein